MYGSGDSPSRNSQIGSSPNGSSADPGGPVPLLGVRVQDRLAEPERRHRDDGRVRHVLGLVDQLDQGPEGLAEHVVGQGGPGLAAGVANSASVLLRTRATAAGWARVRSRRASRR